MKVGFATAAVLLVFAALLPARAEGREDEVCGLVSGGEDLLARAREAGYWGLVELAQKNFEQALEIDADSVLAHRGRQDCRLILREKEEVLKQYEKLLEDNPESADYIYLFSRLVDEPKEQYKLLMKAVKIDGESYWAHYGLGEMKYRAGAYKGCIEQFERCIEIDSRRPEPYSVLIVIYMKEALNLAEARKICERAVKNLSSPAFARSALGGVMLLNGRADKAIEHFAAAVELDPDNCTYRLQLAETLLKEGKSEEAKERAREQLRTIPDLGPDHSESALAVRLARQVFEPRWKLTGARKRRFDTARRYLEHGKLEPALGIIETLISEKDEVALLYYYKGRVLHRQGRPMDAWKQYRKAVELNEKFAEPYQEIARLYLALNRLEDAEKNALKAIEINPFVADAHSCLALIYHRKNNYEEALRSAARFYALRHDYEEIRNYLIDEVRINENDEPDYSFETGDCTVKIFRGKMPTGSDVHVHWRIQVMKDGKVAHLLFAEGVIKFDEESGERRTHYYLSELLDESNTTRPVFLGTNWLNLENWCSAVSRYLSDINSSAK